MFKFNDKIIYDNYKFRKYRAFSCTIESFFIKYRTLTISFIKLLLIKEGFIYNPFYNDQADYRYNEQIYNSNSSMKEVDDNEIMFNNKMIYDVVESVLVAKGIIIRNDFINKEPEYILLDKHLWSSSYSKSYSNLSDADTEDKEILLISDTHIGNERIEDFKLLRNLYEYALNRNIKTCLHLGDLFDKNINGYADFLSNINSFMNNYPPAQIRTYAILGNHDLAYQNYFKNLSTFRNYDFRSLLLCRPLFYMFPCSSDIIYFNNTKIHLSHRLYYDTLEPNLRISRVADLNNVDRFIYPNYNLNFQFFKPSYKVNISGHLHQGFIKTTNDNSLYIGVPSTSKINTLSSIAIIVKIHYCDSNLESIYITPLYRSQYHYTVIESETIYYNLTKSSGVLSKTL